MTSEEDRPGESGPPDHEESDSDDHRSSDAASEEPSPSDIPPSGGSIRFQDPATTEPRPATVGEARARAKAIRQREEAEQARLAKKADREKLNRRLIGGAAVVGVVGLIAALHSAHKVTAQCVQDDSNGQPVVVSDYHCTGHSGPGGFFFYAGHSYRYYYGSSGSIGSPPVGGTTVAPKGATITTRSGTTIQRGGLGSRLFGGSGS